MLDLFCKLPIKELKTIRLKQDGFDEFSKYL